MRGRPNSIVRRRRCKVFLYLPFEPSESLADQEGSVALFEANEDEAVRSSVLDYARRHREIIARFGRFSHRSAALGRTGTDEERLPLRRRVLLLT